MRPIGFGEVLRRILGKSILSIIGHDVQVAAGVNQLLAGHGQPADCEAAVHALRQIFADLDTEAVLLVDAKNAFNSLNRPVALRNVELLCPSISAVLRNTDRWPAELFVDNETIM